MRAVLSLLLLISLSACRERMEESETLASKARPLRVVDRIGNGYGLKDLTKDSDHTLLVLAEWTCPHSRLAAKDLHAGYGACAVKFILGDTVKPSTALLRSLKGADQVNIKFYDRSKVFSPKANIRIVPQVVPEWKDKFVLQGTPTFVLVNKMGHYVTHKLGYDPVVEGRFSENFTAVFDAYCKSKT